MRWGARPRRRPAEFRLLRGLAGCGVVPRDRVAARGIAGGDIAASSPPGYADPAGHPALRTAVARHIAVSRGVRATPGTVLITAGAQGAMSLLGAVMVDPGMTVAVEEPGYPPARDLFAALGARVVPVPVDRDGLVVDALPATRDWSW